MSYHCSSCGKAHEGRPFPHFRPTTLWEKVRCYFGRHTVEGEFCLVCRGWFAPCRNCAHTGYWGVCGDCQAV